LLYQIAKLKKIENIGQANYGISKKLKE